MGTALESFDKRSPLFDLTVINLGLKWPMQPKSTRAWSLLGESTSVTRLPSANTAYPVTGTCRTPVVFSVTGIHVTKIVPSCGPPSTLTSIGGSGRAEIVNKNKCMKKKLEAFF
jgi:hypothetical protein